MEQTPEQLEWIKANADKLRARGYNPEMVELDPEGNIVEIPKRSILGTLARQGAKSILPTGASFAGGAALAPLGLGAGPLAPVAVPALGLLGALGAGSLAGVAQDAVLNKVAPDFQKAVEQGQSQHPVASWIGENAAMAATMKPNFRVLADASVLGKSALNSPAFKAAVANAAVNAGGAVAGQGINMLQGGEFEPGRLAADIGIGAVFVDPNKLGQRFGLHPSSQPNVKVPVKDLAFEQSRMNRERAGIPADAADVKAAQAQADANALAAEIASGKRDVKADKAYTKWWKSETAPTDKMFDEAVKASKLTIPPEKLAELRQMPEAIEALKSPEAFRDFVWQSSEEALQEAWLYKKKQGELLTAEEVPLAQKALDRRNRRMAQAKSPELLAAQMGAGRERAEALRPSEPYVPRGADLPPGEVPPFIPEPKAPEPAKPASKKREVISPDLLEPSAEDLVKVQENEAALNRAQEEKDAAELAKLKDLEAADQLSQEAKARLDELEAPLKARAKLNRSLGLPENLLKQTTAETPEIVQARQEAKAAEDLKNDLYNRLSRSPSDASKPLTQAELDMMTQVAARRGLEVHFEDLGDNRGQYVIATKEGQPLLKVNPLTATMDTIAHEVGHDVFNRSASEGMRGSLSETALGSDAYKREYEARRKAGLSHEQAHAIAAEEGVVDAFAKAGRPSDAKDIRSWFKAFKASVKHIAGMKLAPEDAIAWMHYATHNDTPWSGLGNRSGLGTRDQPSTVDQLNDARYLELAKDPEANAAELRAMVEAAAKRAGYSDQMYHGTKHKFDPAHEFRLDREQYPSDTPQYRGGVSLTTQREFADDWGGARYGGETKELYVNHGKMAHGKDPQFVDQLVAERLNEAIDQVMWNVKYNGIKPEVFNADGTVNPEKVRALAEVNARKDLVSKGLDKSHYLLMEKPELLRQGGYDSTVTTEARDNPVKNTFVLDPKRIKYSDLVTRDDAGNIIPLSKRFNNQTADLRYQGPALGPVFDPELKKLRVVNPQVGDAMKAAMETRDRTIGELQSRLTHVAALSEPHKIELLNHLAAESDSGQLAAPPAHLQQAYDQYRQEFQPLVPQMFNAAGFGIRTSPGNYRQHGENPTYVPLHHVAPDVREILTTRQGSPEYATLRNEFIDWTEQQLIRRGMTPAEARPEAIARFDTEVNVNNNTPDATDRLGFAGVRKPEGATLPPSWRSNDLMGNLMNYVKRSATDYASQAHIESAPEVMAALGARTYGQDLPINPAVIQATPNIVSHPSTQAVLRDYKGRMADTSAIGHIAPTVSSLALGPISRTQDVITTGLKGLVYLRPSEFVQGTAQFTRNLFDWANLTARSHQSGLNRLDTGANMRHVMGVGDANVRYLTRFASGVNELFQLNRLESIARTLAQNWGETIVGIKRAQALEGDAASVRFMDTLSPDWRVRDDLDLSAQVGRLLQGSYDTRQLPAYMLEGGLAPFLTWSKWSMGQLQAFNDFAVAPLMRGDARPLVGQLLIGLLGGEAVQQVQEWMNNRETRDINWKELQAWAEQNKGELGVPGNMLLASKLLTLTQRMGTFGFAGDMAKGIVEAAAGQSPQGVLHNPSIEAIYGIAKNGTAAMDAISSGEDVQLVLTKLAKDLAMNNAQVARVARNWLMEDENLAYNDRRRQNLFNYLQGEGSSGNTFAVSYKDLKEKEFDKTTEPADMVAKAGELMTEAATKATSQEDFVKRLRKLGTSQNNIMPNPRRQPDKAFSYLKWVHDSEGSEASEDIQKRWQAEDARAKYRKQLVSPGSSGAR